MVEQPHHPLLRTWQDTLTASTGFYTHKKTGVTDTVDFEANTGLSFQKEEYVFCLGVFCVGEAHSHECGAKGVRPEGLLLSRSRPTTPATVPKVSPLLTFTRY